MLDGRSFRRSGIFQSRFCDETIQEEQIWLDLEILKESDNDTVKL